MATVRTIKVHGARVVVEDDDCLWEKRCDACGKWAEGEQLAELQVTIKGPTVSPGTFTLDLHDYCIVSAGHPINERVQPEPPF